ncbi:MAG: glycosyltransferase family 4 protein [Deltaproteobacteria bacterium]|nr:glycosyltransferase family 4 protein [Deltaproteobacteria bacterium]
MLKKPRSEPAPTNSVSEVSSIISESRAGREVERFRLVPSPAVQTRQRTSLRKIAVLGNHLPRRCGIATFTTDLSQAISDEFSALECFVLAMNDAGRHYAYPAQVRVEIATTDVTSYRRAAEFLNVSMVDLVSVQHEYGIFGGKAGSHVLAMLRDLRMPIVTTLHTILAKPNLEQRIVMDELTQLSERLVVMSVFGASILREVHNVPDAKVDLIPHGIPSLPNAQQSRIKLGLEDKSVILTFGLLSPDKGIEHVIDALPAILERFPNTLYIVLGATHPHVKEQHGETYRAMLEERAERLRVESNVVFHNRFVNQKQLTEFLSAADIYITPYLNPEQSTSGTLAYAVGSGKAVISTPYSYASELLAGGRGVIVPWPRDDPQGITHAIIDLLEDNNRRNAICELGATYGSSMLWPEVARTYVRSFERARIEHSNRLRGVYQIRTLAEQPLELPEVNLEHLIRLSDYTGILQHAAFSVPRYEHGYCLDDNARALLLTSLLEEAGVDQTKTVCSLASRYLAFVRYAFDARNGRFINFMSYSRQWIEGVGSEDCHGRALWGLGSVVVHSEDPGQRKLADSLFLAAIESVDDFASPRAWAYALLGIDEYLQTCPGARKVRAVGERLAERLLDLYQQACVEEWPWFEERATYCNARLSQALILFGWRMEHEEMKAAGLRSLEWLSEVQYSPCEDGYFAPIGSNGFYERDGTKAEFDQQPVEACTMVSACLLAQRVTGKKRWALDARRAFNWFLGQNQLQQSLYDPTTGGCRDGLHSDRPNDNQGAESTVSFLLALVEMRLATRSARSDPNKITKLKENIS